jgi:hypothetical protein
MSEVGIKSEIIKSMLFGMNSIEVSAKWRK